MTELPLDQIDRLLQPYLNGPAPTGLLEKVRKHLELLQRWNSKLNLTSVRNPEDMIKRHFGESLLLARLLPAFRTLLDIGSGAGFPGLPISFLYPKAEITLAEAHGKKAAFLREAAQATHSQAIVWPRRVEALPTTDRFDVVVLRAVEQMQATLDLAVARLVPGGVLGFFTNQAGAVHLPLGKWTDVQNHPVPESVSQIVLAKKLDPAS